MKGRQPRNPPEEGLCRYGHVARDPQREALPAVEREDQLHLVELGRRPERPGDADDRPRIESSSGGGLDESARLRQTCRRDQKAAERPDRDPPRTRSHGMDGTAAGARIRHSRFMSAE